MQDAKKASVPPGTSKNYEQDFQNSDPGSQDFLFQKVSAGTDVNNRCRNDQAEWRLR